MNDVARRSSGTELSTTERPPKSLSRLPGLLIAGTSVLAVGAVIGWAIATVLTPPEDVLDSSAYTFVEVVEGEVGSSLNLNTVAAWTPIPVGSNQAQGVVTSVNVSDGQEVGPGAVLYTVNLRPVAIAQGDVPAFRSLSAGTTGADVAQLQAFLASLGFYQGPADGKFGSVTTRAVKAWQKSVGIGVDGVIQPSDLIYVPSLPTRISLDSEVIERGASVSGGEAVLRGLPAEPLFTIPVTDSQAAQIPLGTRVEIAGPASEVWQAFVVSLTTSEDQGSITLTLAGEDGASICSPECESIPVTEHSLLRSKIVIVETEAGLVVPTSAIRSDATGELSVIDDQGEEHDVKVVATAKGMSVVTGTSLGVFVRVPGNLE